MFRLRDRGLAERAVASIREIGSGLRVMHVCGTHQDTLVRHGLDAVLAGAGVDVREGPGCPVCVSTVREVEEAKALARAGKTLALFGDMTRSPGQDGSIESLRASEGAKVVTVYSAMDAVELAEQSDEDVVFVGVGFETTAPGTAVALRESPDNFYVLSLHRLTPPAVEAVARSGEVRLDGIILPGHVCTVTGLDPWRFLEGMGIPAVVAGFEPLDILIAVLEIAKQKGSGVARLVNGYKRVVREEGNPKARSAMEEAFQVVDLPWRGFGVLPGSGLALAPRYADRDPRRAFEDVLGPLADADFPEPAGCRCGDVIRGVLRSEECPLFGTACTPEAPVGPCMVSVEGSCAIAYKYGKF